MNLHANSILSNRETKKLNRRLEILNAHKHFPNGASDRQIKEFLGYDDMNAVRGRTTEMINEVVPKLKEIGHRNCLVTGKWVRVTTPTFFSESAPIPEDLFAKMMKTDLFA